MSGKRRPPVPPPPSRCRLSRDLGMAKGTLGQGSSREMEPKPWCGLAIQVSSEKKIQKKEKNLISRSVMPIAFTGYPPHTRQSFGEVSEESSPLCLHLVPPFVEVTVGDRGEHSIAAQADSRSGIAILRPCNPGRTCLCVTTRYGCIHEGRVESVLGVSRSACLKSRDPSCRRYLLLLLLLCVVYVPTL